MTISLRRITVQMEDTLLLKLLLYFGFGGGSDVTMLEESSFESQRARTADSMDQYKRCYFSSLKINSLPLGLSMFISTNLPKDLAATKRAMRLPLVGFEDAQCVLGKLRMLLSVF